MTLLVKLFLLWLLSDKFQSFRSFPGTVLVADTSVLAEAEPRRAQTSAPRKDRDGEDEL